MIKAELSLTCGFQLNNDMIKHVIYPYIRWGNHAKVCFIETTNHLAVVNVLPIRQSVQM